MRWRMSAIGPKRTTLERTIDLASNAKQLPIGQRNCPNNYDGMAAFPVFGGVSLQPFAEVTIEYEEGQLCGSQLL